MGDSYDYATAIKDVSRQMPEAAKEIREYVAKLKAKIAEPIDINAETVSK